MTLANSFGCRKRVKIESYFFSRARGGRKKKFLTILLPCRTQGIQRGESRTPNHRSLLTRDDGLGARRRCGARPCGRLGPWRWSGPRSGGRCCARRSCRCRRRRWSGRGATNRRLDRNHHRRACFEVADCRIGILRRLIGIETEIVQCAPANRLRFLVRANVSVFQVMESGA